MGTDKLKNSFENLGNALDRLEELVELPVDEHDAVVDATVKRFEFTHESFWKCLKRLLANVGIITKNPNETMKHAFQQNWIDDEALWLKMRKDRNTASHEYNADKIEEIYGRITVLYYPELRKTYEALKQQYTNLLK